MRRLFVLNRKAAHGDIKRLREQLQRCSREGDDDADASELLPDPTSAELLAAVDRLDPETGILVAVGGDGTVNRILQVVGPARCVIGLLPAGRANDLAGEMGLPNDWAAALRILRDRYVRRLDVAVVNGRFFVTAGGVGLPARVAARANGDGARSWRTYPSIACREAWTSGRGPEVQVAATGAAWSDAALAVVWSNQPRFGRRFRLSPRASNRDGLLDCCAIPDPRCALGRLRVIAGALCGSAARERRFWRARAEAWSLRSPVPLPFFGDGEILDHASEFTIRILPCALRVVVPEASCSRR